VKKLHLLLGGIPLGCNHVGVEAILICVVEILRRIQPEAEITVSTAIEAETAARLGIKTLPLYGFSPAPRLAEFARTVRQFDLFVWCGANGLSDYPETALKLLLCAQKQGVLTLLWGVGMDSELNPFPSKTYLKTERMLNCFDKLIHWGFFSIVEKIRKKRIQQKIRQALEKSLLVVVRDPETAQALLTCGFSRSIIGADSAMLLSTATESPVKRENGIYKIGFCLSAQSPILQQDELCALWQRLSDQPEQRLILIPMDSQTDYAYMETLRKRLPHQEHIDMVSSSEPATIQAIAANCDVVVSSRLILLILAANAGTPIIGIESGSKIRNWLRVFDLKPVGSVSNCEFERIEEAILGFRKDNGEAFCKKIAFVYCLLRKRLALAEEDLRCALETIANCK